MAGTLSGRRGMAAHVIQAFSSARQRYLLWNRSVRSKIHSFSVQLFSSQTLHILYDHIR